MSAQVYGAKIQFYCRLKCEGRQKRHHIFNASRSVFGARGKTASLELASGLKGSITSKTNANDSRPEAKDKYKETCCVG